MQEEYIDFIRRTIIAQSANLSRRAWEVAFGNEYGLPVSATSRILEELGYPDSQFFQL